MFRVYLSISIAIFLLSGNAMSQSANSLPEDSTTTISSIEEAILVHTSIQKRLSLKQKRVSIEELLKMYDAINRFEIDSITNAYEFEIALEYFYANSLSRALLYTSKSISSFNPKQPNYDILAQAHNLEGIINMEFGNFSQAIDGFTASMEAYQLYAPSRVTYPIGNLSNVYYLIGDIENAIKYTMVAVKHSKKLQGNELYYNYGYDCCKLSGWYDQLNELDSASYYLQKSLSLVAHLDTVQAPYKSLVLMVNEQAYKYHLKRNNIKAAKEYLDKVLVGSYGSAKLKTDLLKAQMDLATGNKQKLLNFLDQPIDPSNSLEEKTNLFKFKLDVYKKYALYEKALATYEAFQELKKNDAKINQQQYADFAYAQFETFEKEKEIQRLTKLSEINRLKSQKLSANYFAVFALIFGLFSTLFFYYYFRFRRKDRFNKQLEKEVEKKTAALSKLNDTLLNKNEELERFNFILSHDLKEPIRSIVSFSNLIYKKANNDEEIQEFAQYVTNSGKQLNQLLGDISDFQYSNRLVVKKENINLAETISEIKRANTYLIKKKNVSISHDELPVIFSSKVGLFIILKNLIENGIKYNNSDQVNIHISVQEKEIEYSIMVKDNGLGIKEIYFDQIFTMFKRLHNRKEYQGSGLGLSICSKVALKLNGTIEVMASRLGEGTTFKLTIPKEEYEARASADTKKEAIEMIHA